ncbi:EthD domain-containing protein [Tsuneonella mangrovi]|uniref:EthD domain-containing protein n=1 Tax=Tsuneonella mangrovi TaxID=1982042 RepID=UPI000BA21EB7|nr:EthD domain-containing protein [Tsuneonella mangrovi]
MLKLTLCVHRLPSLTREEFQKHWRENHAPLVRAAAEALGIRRYVQSHTFEHPIADGTAQARGMVHGDDVDFDGLAELWFDSEEALLAARATPEGRKHGAILLEDEARFIDFTRSFAFVSHENVVIG